MFHSDRYIAVARLLFRYVESPSLKHIRDSKSLHHLASDILKAIDREPTIWRKWDEQREAVLKAASVCWVPFEDLQQFLNEMPGPHLTLTDVQQRLRTHHLEPYSDYPNAELQAGCEALYAREKAAGTELPAIIGALQEFVEDEEERLRLEQQEAWRARQAEERRALQARFLAGADCKWTPLEGREGFFTRRNGRAYRIEPTKDKRWRLLRIADQDDAGAMIGTYGTRTDANKVLAKLAYEPEPRW